MKTKLNITAIRQCAALFAALFIAHTGFSQTLVGRWQFLEGSGTSTVNSVTNFNATLEGGAAFTAFTNPWGGSNGTVLLGTGNYIDTGLAGGSLLSTTGSYSISVWGYYNGGTPGPWTLVSAATDTTGNSLIDGNAATNEVHGQVFGPSYANFTATPWVGGVANNAWNNYTLVNDTSTSTVKIYLNGTNVETASYTGTPFSDVTGAWLFGGRDFFQGYISDVQFYTGALSQTQITDVILAGNAVPEPSAAALLGLGVMIVWMSKMRQRARRSC